MSSMKPTVDPVICVNFASEVHIPMEKSHEITMFFWVKSPFSHRIPWFPILFLGFSYGFPIVFLRFSYGFPMVFPRLSVRKIHLGQPGSSKHWGCVYAPFPSPLSNVSTPQTWDRSKGVWFFWKTRLRSKLGTMEFDAYFSWWFRMTTVVIHVDSWWLLVVQPTTTGNYRDLITINHGINHHSSPELFTLFFVTFWKIYLQLITWFHDCDHHESPRITNVHQRSSPTDSPTLIHPKSCGNCAEHPLGKYPNGCHDGM